MPGSGGNWIEGGEVLWPWGGGRAGCITGGGEGLEVGRRDREFWGRGWARARARDLFL